MELEFRVKTAGMIAGVKKAGFKPAL